MVSRIRAALTSVRARVRDALVGRLRNHPRLAERGLALTRRVPGRSRRAALYRSFSWPVIDGLPRELEVSSPGGRMLVDTGDVVGRVLAASGVWEPHVTDALRGHLHPGDVCVDVGAHLGYYTLLASQLVGGRGHVYAFEPSPGMFRRLQANLALNGVTNVSALNIAAGAEASSGVLYEPAGVSGNASLSPRLLDSPHAAPAEEYTGVRVEVRTVESAIPTVELERVRVVKVDVEGYEVEALRGLDRILEQGTPIALFVELSPEWSLDDPAPFLESLCVRHGLTPFRLVNEYSLYGYFPRHIEPPERIEAIPSGRCDLMLVRGAGP